MSEKLIEVRRLLENQITAKYGPVAGKVAAFFVDHLGISEQLRKFKEEFPNSPVLPKMEEGVRASQRRLAELCSKQTRLTSWVVKVKWVGQEGETTRDYVFGLDTEPRKVFDFTEVMTLREKP